MSRSTFNKKVDEFNRRLKAIEEYDPDSVVLERYRGLFTRIDYSTNAVKTIKTIEDRLTDLLQGDELSLDSYKRSKAQGIKTLQDEGLDFINERNFNSYMRFLNDAQARGLGNVFDSDKIVELIHEAKKQGLTKGQIRENIRRWAKQYVKYDKEGKQIEVVNPDIPKVVKVRKLHIDRRKRKRKKRT